MVEDIVWVGEAEGVVEGVKLTVAEGVLLAESVLVGTTVLVEVGVLLIVDAGKHMRCLICSANHRIRQKKMSKTFRSRKLT